MADALLARHFYLDPARHKEAVELVATVARLPPERLADRLFTKNDCYRNPDGLPDLDALQAEVDLQHQRGFLKSSFDVRKYADLDLARAAVAQVN